jgi:hypothetical protein
MGYRFDDESSALRSRFGVLDQSLFSPSGGRQLVMSGSSGFSVWRTGAFATALCGLVPRGSMLGCLRANLLRERGSCQSPSGVRH